MPQHVACRLILLLSVVACAPRHVTNPAVALHPNAPECDIAAASPWIRKWFGAWELTSERILRVPNVAPPDIIFYDTRCVYTTSAVTASTPPLPGPWLSGAKLEWHTALHHDTLTLPNHKRIPVQLTIFASGDKSTGRLFFVMAAPEYWQSKGIGGDYTGVFLHEFTHTRQVGALGPIIGHLDEVFKSKFNEEVDDDAVQNHFKSDSAYVTAYRAERDLLYRAANADSVTEVRRLAAEALQMGRARQKRWFTGDNEIFSTVDDTFMSLEGAAQWSAIAWHAHPSGGGMTKAAAIAKLLGSRRFWTQDEGAALFLVIDRLMPGWPGLVFSHTSIGAYTLLDRALSQQ